MYLPTVLQFRHQELSWEKHHLPKVLTRYQVPYFGNLLPSTSALPFFGTSIKTSRLRRPPPTHTYPSAYLTLHYLT